MKYFITTFFCCFCLSGYLWAQLDSIENRPRTVTLLNTSATLPYREIPEPPTIFTAATTAARMVDGLGYRYYWATESLRDEDLAYQLSDESRSVIETLDHIYGLSEMIVNGSKNELNIRGGQTVELTWEEKRQRTLNNLKVASDLLKAEETDLHDKNIIFQKGEQISTFPYWNMLNGPIADAL